MDTTSMAIGALGGATVASAAAFFAISSNKKALDFEKRTNKLMRQMFDNVEEMVGMFKADGTLVYANKAMRQQLGADEKAVQVKPEAFPRIRIKQETFRLDELLEKQVGFQEKGSRMTVLPQCRMETEGRDSKPITIYAQKIFDSNKKETIYAVVIHDLSKQEAEKCLVHAHQLTELPNEIQAKKDLNRIFSRSHLHNKKLALIVMEIDNFSQIRAMIGHEQAEKQLIQIARYLEAEAEAIGGFVYHMFMNVFMVVLPKIDREEEVEAFCEKVERQLENFYEVNNIKLHLSASMGIAIHPDSGSTFMLLDNAYKALSEAQKAGFGQFKFYNALSGQEMYDELELYNSLHDAIDKKEFMVYYQPIVRATDLEIVGAEALIRWKHPKYGFVPPSLFVPMLEKSGFVIELGRYVLETVLKQLKRWELFKFKPVQVSINMSMLELESEGFVVNVEKQLEEHNVAPELLKFEITEGVAMQNETLMHERLERIKKMGISIALDDFGTGYTSFSYLKKIPADLVKIDRSMIVNVLESEEDERIVHAMIELGHNLDMKVVVEGIEDEWMMKKLQELGCDYMQGFFFSKPLPAYEFQELIRMDSKFKVKTSDSVENFFKEE
jgi:polar amino acid transport system substrate-binding protein